MFPFALCICQCEIISTDPGVTHEAGGVNFLHENCIVVHTFL